MRIHDTKLQWTIGVIAIMVFLSAHGAGRGLDDLIESVLRSGRDARLPPHLSLVLGLGTGDTPLVVKQAVLREGPEMRVFNVCVANHKDVVILRTDETKQNTKAFLLSTTGKLRNAVYYHAGEQPQRIPTAEASALAADEVKFWTGLAQRRGAVQ